MHQRNEFKTPPNFQKLKFHSNLALPIPHSLSPGVYTSRSIETRSIDLTASAGRSVMFYLFRD